MILTYISRELERICEDERVMRKKRADIEKKLRLRINALRQCTKLGELRESDPGGHWHRLGGDRDGQWAGRVSFNERVVIEPTEDGRVLVSLEEQLTATEAKVIWIGDYHRK